MNSREINKKQKIEEEVRSLFNRHNQTSAEKAVLSLGRKGASHEFDLYNSGKVIGGITTSPWKNKTGSNNTGGQDRASTELLWLTLWEGNENRVMILTDREMADKLFKRWQGCPFPHQIEIIHYDESKRLFERVGMLRGKL